MSVIVLYVIWLSARFSVSHLIDTYQMHFVTYHHHYVNQKGEHLKIVVGLRNFLCSALQWYKLAE